MCACRYPSERDVDLLRSYVGDTQLLSNADAFVLRMIKARHATPLTGPARFKRNPCAKSWYGTARVCGEVRPWSRCKNKSVLGFWVKRGVLREGGAGEDRQLCWAAPWPTARCLRTSPALLSSVAACSRARARTRARGGWWLVTDAAPTRDYELLHVQGAAAR